MEKSSKLLETTARLEGDARLVFPPDFRLYKTCMAMLL